MENNIKELSYKEVAAQFPKAWAKVPTSYKNDSCLKFFVDINGTLCSEADLGGHSECYVFTGKQWVQG
jgi:hypothetical protein